MVAAGDQRAGRSVIIQGSVQGTVGGKSGYLQLVRQPEGGSSALKVSCHRTGGMGCQAVGAATKVLQGGEFPQVVTGIDNESHAQLYTIHAEVQGFQPPHVA